MKKLAKRMRREGKTVEMVEEIKDTRNGSLLGALHVAALSGMLEMCSFLIEDLHLDVNAAAHHGSSPLICSLYGQEPERAVKFLLDHGADPNLANREGFTVLHVVATKQDLLPIADTLLSRGAHVDSLSEWGTPLHLAAQCGNVEAMKLLLNYKANPNRVVQNFYAPLTLSLLASSLKCVELLIKAGADVNAGRPVTPLVVAAMGSLSDCIACLLEAHADPNIPDQIGSMPVEVAAKHGWKECVEILFPVTSRIAGYTDWSIDGIIQHVKYATEPEHKDSITHFNLVGSWNGTFAPGPVSNSGIISEQDSAIVLHSSALSTGPSRIRSFKRFCWQGVKVGRILASQLGVSASAIGSNLHYLNEEFSEAKSWFKHMSSYESSGHGCVARVADDTASVSKMVSKVFGGASSTLRYGGDALSSVGLSLQTLHPEAQSGTSASNVIVQTVKVESVEDAEKVIDEWKDLKELVIADVPSHMEREMAEKIWNVFRDAGAFELVENSPVLTEKVDKVLVDWHIL